MSFVVIAGERYALPIGETLLGGNADDALAAPALAAMEPSAVVEVMPDGGATLRATDRGDVRVDGAPLAGVLVLRHGLRVDVAGVSLIFGDIGAHGATMHLASATGDAFAAFGALGAGEPTADTGGRLTLPDGTVVAIPPSGLTIGRDPACGLPVTDMSVSRRHATIAPSLQGYTLTDLSVNGVAVNGVKIDGSVVLGMRDRIRIGDIEFRFEADQSVLEAPASTDERVSTEATTPASISQQRAKLLATLEVINVGLLHGTRFRIERPVIHIGRGKHNDIQLADDSVSGSHATLTRRGSAWVIADLGSTNGTYVDGERLFERSILGSAELRFGNIKMIFRPIAGSSDDRLRTRAIGLGDAGS